MRKILCIVFGFGLLVAGGGAAAELRALPDQPSTNLRTFQAQGMVKEVPADGRTVVIAHEAIPNYMEAMTMPFKVKEPGELAGLRPGDNILFRLWVTDTESWIEGISKNTGAQTVGQASRLSGGSLTLGPSKAGETPDAAGETPAPLRRHPLLDYPFTNELAQAVKLSDFRGQALAITFFFTRCPIPEFCPRLSKNFEEASDKLSAMPGGPTNWHFLSVTFDPESDTPSVLKAYGERYQYDPKHWSFLTGPKEGISELARGSDVKFEPANGFINHSFRTLIIDAAGHLQMVFPTSGNLTDAIVAEVLKAAAVPSRSPGSDGGEAEARTTALAR
jgi:protein SCO1